MIFHFAFFDQLQTFFACRRPRIIIQQKLPRLPSQLIRFETTAKDSRFQTFFVDHASVFVEGVLPFFHRQRLSAFDLRILLEIDLEKHRDKNSSVGLEQNGDENLINHFESVVRRLFQLAVDRFDQRGEIRWRCQTRRIVTIDDQIVLTENGVAKEMGHFGETIDRRTTIVCAPLKHLEREGEEVTIGSSYHAFENVVRIIKKIQLIENAGRCGRALVR